MIIAAIFEFLGAVLLGGHVSDTIRKGIADQECFRGFPAALMWGMVAVCLCTGIWLYIATFLELPVSTTHSAVGGVVGAALVIVGGDCIVWAGTSSTFPFVKGVASIVMSWVFSPVLSAVLAALIYVITRQFVLRAPNSTEMALRTYPLLLWFCTALILFYLLVKGAKGQNDALGWDPEDEDLPIAIGVCVGGGLLCALLSLAFKPFLRRKSEEEPDNDEDIKQQEVARQQAIAADQVNMEEKPGVLSFITRALATDVDQIVAENSTVADIHAQAEKFSPKTEIVFKYMQVVTAALDAFAHGANDVANAMGPFAAIFFIYQSGGNFSKKNDVGNNMYWILAIGGLGIVTGLGAERRHRRACAGALPAATRAAERSPAHPAPLPGCAQASMATRSCTPSASSSQRSRRRAASRSSLAPCSSCCSARASAFRSRRHTARSARRWALPPPRAGSTRPTGALSARQSWAGSSR